MTFDDDLSAFFSDFAVTATWGDDPPETAEVILDHPDVLMLGNDCLAADIRMTFRANQLVGIDEGDVVIIDGINYLLRETPASSADGAVMVVSVSRQP